MGNNAYTEGGILVKSENTSPRAAARSAPHRGIRRRQNAVAPRGRDRARAGGGAVCFRSWPSIQKPNARTDTHFSRPKQAGGFAGN